MTKEEDESKQFTGTPIRLTAPSHLKGPTPLFKKEIDVQSYVRRKPNGKNKVVHVKPYICHRKNAKTRIKQP
jgi:hypothetical protein